MDSSNFSNIKVRKGRGVVVDQVYCDTDQVYDDIDQPK
jgi:hypothetical protein